MYYEYYSPTVFFENTTPDKPGYTPFYFTMHSLYYDVAGWQNPSDTDFVNKTQILKEWEVFFKHKFSKKAIDTLLYSDDSTAVFQQIQSGKTAVIKNEFSAYLQQAQNAEVLNYLAYAKACEVNANVKTNAWPEEKEPTVKTNAELKAEGLRAIKTVKQPFLHMKYAFQIIRMAFYNQDYEGVLQLYNQLIGNKKDSSVAFTRILGFKAGAYYHLHQKVKAGYYYSKAFENNSAYRLEAMQSFNWALSNPEGLSDIRLNGIYALCKNNHERAVVLGMKTLQNSKLCLDDLKKIYSYDPDLSDLDVLINREVNKLEYLYFSKKIDAQNFLNSNSYYGRNHTEKFKRKLAKLDKKYQPYLDELSQFLNQIITDNKNGTPAFWHLTKAYLAAMQNEHAQVGRELAAAKAVKMTPKEHALYQRIDLLHVLLKSPQITSATEQVLLPKLKTLQQHALKQSPNRYDSDDKNFAKQQLKDLMQNVIAGKYLNQGDTIKAIYAMAHGEIVYDYRSKQRRFWVDRGFGDAPGQLLSQLSPQQLKTVIRYRKSPNKSAFENWLVSGTYYTADHLKELLATTYMRHQEFQKAADILKNTTLETQYPSPFMPRINDRIDVDRTHLYTKLSYSKRMAELKKIITQNPNDTGALYGYALALYNTSYYGPAWHLTAYFRHSTDDHAYFKRPSVDQQLAPYLEEYYRVYKAEQYFIKTVQAAKDPELKAKALWGAAKCWQKRTSLSNTDLDEYEIEYNYISRYNHQDEYYRHSLKNPYFEKLKTQYANTDFVQRARQHCDYFEDYL